MNVRSFLIAQGLIEPYAMPHSGEFRINCPECKHPNNKCYVNAEGKGVNCKHCNYSKSWYGFTRRYTPPTPSERALERLVRASIALRGTQVSEYLSQRLLEPQNAEIAQIGYIPSDYNEEPQEGDIEAGLYNPVSKTWTLAGRILIPYIKDGYIVTIRGRAFDEGVEPKYKSLPGSKVQLYTPDTLDTSKPVFVAEGEFDAMLLNQLGFQSVGIPGANTGKDFVEFFSRFQKVYLVLDCDDAGRKASSQLKKAIPEVYEVSLPEGYDVTEYVNTFGKESLSQLIDNSLFYIDGKLQEDDSLKATITSFLDWTWSNGEILGAKIGWAPRLESALSGWSKGLFLIGAIANSGKSCFLVKSAYEAAKSNPQDTVVVYLSLDDDREDAVCRLASLHTGISFEELRTPKISFDHPTDKSKRNPLRLKYIQEKMEELKEYNNLIIRDASFGRSLQYIRLYTALLRKRHPDKKIVIFIDSLAKLTAESEPQSISTLNWKAHLANELKYLSTIHNLCIVTPADFRKLNDLRRPTNDDLKDAAELAYEANCVLLGFNEVSLKGLDNSTLKWSDPNTGQEWPILELNLSKNKKSMYRGAIRFKFFPPTSNFEELTAEQDSEFTRKIRENEQRRIEARRELPKFGSFNNFSTTLTRFNL